MHQRLLALCGVAALVVTSGCDKSPTGSPQVNPAVAGNWISRSAIPGSGLNMTLNVTNGIVTGTGTQFVEAGAPRPFSVTGTAQSLHFALVFHYDADGEATYTGSVDTAISPPFLVGDLAETSGTPRTVLFFRPAPD